MEKTEIETGDAETASDWDALPGLPFLLATHAGRGILRASGIEPISSLLLVCGEEAPSTGLARCLADELDVPLRRLDMGRVAALGEAGARARLLDTWDRIARERGVYLLDGLETLAGGGVALMCRLLDSGFPSDSVVLAVARSSVPPCLAARFAMSLEAA